MRWFSPELFGRIVTDRERARCMKPSSCHALCFHPNASKRPAIDQWQVPLPPHTRLMQSLLSVQRYEAGARPVLQVVFDAVTVAPLQNCALAAQSASSLHRYPSVPGAAAQCEPIVASAAVQFGFAVQQSPRVKHVVLASQTAVPAHRPS